MNLRALTQIRKQLQLKQEIVRVVMLLEEVQTVTRVVLAVALEANKIKARRMRLHLRNLGKHMISRDTSGDCTENHIRMVEI
jgi:hypothetical protein